MVKQFYFQMGHGQKGMIKNLMEIGIGDGIILSPRDIEYSKNIDFVNDIRKIKTDASIIFDPQFYFPKFKHDNIASYPYFLKKFVTSDFYSDSTQRKNFIQNLVETQETFDADIMLTPAVYREVFSIDSFRQCLNFASEFQEFASSTDKPIYLTLVIHIRTLLDENYFNRVLNLVTDYAYDGIYLVLELDEEDKFLWTDQTKMFLVMKFLHHLINNNLKIILGYSSQSVLPLLLTGVESYASGHFLNLRTFKSERWLEKTGIRTPKDLYYSHKLFTNLNVDSDLELLFQRNRELYNQIRSPSPFDEILFSDHSPATVTWRKYSWLHYLYYCNEIKKQIKGTSKPEKFNHFYQIIDDADKLFSSLLSKGVSFKRRINDGSHIRAWLAATKAYENEFT